MAWQVEGFERSLTGVSANTLAAYRSDIDGFVVWAARAGLNDPTGTGDSCPQELWDRIDVQVLTKEYNALGTVKNGPRLWCLHWIEGMTGRSATSLASRRTGACGSM